MTTWSAQERTVLFVETDASGWVHNSHFMRYVENAEHELFLSLGISPLQTGAAWPRVHFEVDFRSPLLYNDPYQVHLSLVKLGTSSIRWGFEIISDQRLVAEGEMVSVQVGKERRALPLTESLKSSLQDIFKD